VPANPTLRISPQGLGLSKEETLPIRSHIASYRLSQTTLSMKLVLLLIMIWGWNGASGTYTFNFFLNGYFWGQVASYKFLLTIIAFLDGFSHQTLGGQTSSLPQGSQRVQIPHHQR
jgi:hypothetical protein